MEAREGDLIETAGNLIFDVKGLVHPPKHVIAFIRYFPHEIGNRTKNDRKYQKVYSLKSRYEWLQKNRPDYLVYDQVFDEVLCEVPAEDVKKHYKPTEKLRQLRTSKEFDAIEENTLQLSTLLKQGTNTPWAKIGVTGSMLVDLHSTASDIDVLVYGAVNCRRVHKYLQETLENRLSPFQPYSTEDLKKLYDFRSKDTEVSFEDFVRTERRKVLQGKFLQTDYFLRLIKDYDEIEERYGQIQYVNAGDATIEATIADDTEALFTPCTYVVKEAVVKHGFRNAPIERIVSFRGRFCEHARKGELVTAHGKVEHVIDNKRNQQHYRLLLGNKPSDYMTLL